MALYKYIFSTFLTLFLTQGFSQSETKRETCRQCVQNKLKEGANKNVTVYVAFNLNPDSSITQVRITRSHCEACNEEALQIFSKMRFDNLVQKTAVQYVHPIRIILN